MEKILNEGDNQAMDLFLAGRDIFELIFTEFAINEQFVFRAETVVKEGAHKKLFSADSEWLTSSDIKALKKYEKERQGLGQNKIKCLFFSSLHSAGEMGPFAELRQKIEQNNDVSAIILICTSEQGIASCFFNSDHWFTFVVNVKERMHEYVVADSISQSRLDDPRVKCLVEYLEGKSETLEVPQREMQVRAIIGVVGGVVYFTFFLKRKKDAPKQKTTQSQRIEVVEETVQPFLMAPGERKEADGGPVDSEGEKVKRIATVHDTVQAEASVAA